MAIVSVLTGSYVDIPDAASARRDFDEWLCSEPETIDPDKQALMIALGLR